MEDRLQGGVQLQAHQLGTETMVDAAAEGEVGVGVAVDGQLVGSVERNRVPVGRAEGDRGALTGFNASPTDAQRFRRQTRHAKSDRWAPPQ